MGLNLKINRIIFTSLKRRHSNGFLKRIDEEEIKQIAGRAGRYLADGRVACSYLEDLKIVKTALKDMNENLSKTEMKKKIEKKMKKSSKLNLSGDEDEIEDIIGLLEKKPEKQPIFLLKKNLDRTNFEIKQAVLFPLFNQIEKFAEELEIIENKKLDLSYIFNTFMKVAQYQTIYSPQHGKDFCELADIIQDCNLDLKDHFCFATAPVNLSRQMIKIKRCFKNFAFDFVNLNYVSLPHNMIPKNFMEIENALEKDLLIYEELHHIFDIYLWFSNKYETIFTEKAKALKFKSKTIEIIEKILQEI